MRRQIKRKLGNINFIANIRLFFFLAMDTILPLFFDCIFLFSLAFHKILLFRY